ncbi:MAG: hypothetical protein CMH56_00640 [Myxococcales bacterium]|nr:hypothetical protein [Myxococcales bacterium]|tara:strand:- start:56 stop:433 length:378 start_codon:yes stop_codon:yes gene_type:complete
MKAPISEATTLLQKGHLDGARQLLEQFQKAYPETQDNQVDALLYFAYRGLGDTTQAIAICDKRLAHSQKKAMQSIWHLRRGILHLRAHQEIEAMDDFHTVLKINCNAEHVSQAKKSLAEANITVN